MVTHRILPYVLITLVYGALALPADAVVSLRGDAELRYVTYDASVNGQRVYSGNSFNQKYSIDLLATNRFSAIQRQYYTLQLGYDWLSFDTSVNDAGQNNSLKDSFGKLRYKGEVGYQPPELPFYFKAYSVDDYTPYFKSVIMSNIMSDDLTYLIDNRFKGGTTGFTFVYDADRAPSTAMRGLPKLYVDYRETVVKLNNGVFQVDNKRRELSVAGLNKENNWLKYSNIRYENYLQTADNYETNRLEIGLVDNAGRRKWSSLTNWIDVSADGSLSLSKYTDSGITSELYDLNFMAVATRRAWSARTFMNYNRAVTADSQTDLASVPLYIRGDYSPDTDWYASVRADRGTRLSLTSAKEKSYTNSLSTGITTFKRSSFTLAPSVSIMTSKSFGSYDAYNITAGLATASTRYFSNTHSINADYRFSFADDGTNNITSKTWQQAANVKWDYWSGPLKAVLKEEMVYGHGPVSLDVIDRQQVVDPGDRVRGYVRSTTDANLAWVPTSKFSATLDTHYDFRKSQGLPNATRYSIGNKLLYEHSDVFYRMLTEYREVMNGNGGSATELQNVGTLEFRPNRYHEGTVQYTVNRRTENGIDSSKVDFLQRYKRNFFTTSGQIRNAAVLSEEFVYTLTYNGAEAMSLLLSGSYQPTSRLGLYGSAKMQKNPGSITMIYNAGLSADFRLLTANLDYSFAKRDSDNRLERKLTAAVKRSF